MSAAEELYCNRVIGTITAVGRSMMRLHGRDLDNMFALYGAERQQDTYDLACDIGSSRFSSIPAERLLDCPVFRYRGFTALLFQESRGGQC